MQDKKSFKVLDGIRFDSAKWYEDADGNVRVPVIVAQAGVLNYTYVDEAGKRIDVAEAKLPEELLSKHSVFSSEGKPITLEHPPGMVTPENYQLYAKGVFINPVVVGDALHGEIVIYDKELQDQIKSGERYQISPGFWSNTEYKKGTFRGDSFDAAQRDIMFNHFAIVKEGRAGDNVRVKLDGKNLEQIISEVELMRKKRTDMSEEDKTKIDQYEEEKKASEKDADEMASSPESEIEKLQKENELLKAAVDEDKPMDPEKDEDGEMSEEEKMIEQLKAQNEMLKAELDKRDKKDSTASYLEARDMAMRFCADTALNLYHSDINYFKRAVVDAAGHDAKMFSGAKLDGAYELAKSLLTRAETHNADSFIDSSIKDKYKNARKDAIDMTDSRFSGKIVIKK